MENKISTEKIRLTCDTKPKVAFICVHNSCRSQIAEALAKYYGKDVLDAYSAGTALKSEINQDAVRLIKDIYGIDMEKDQFNKLITDIPTPNVVITMGCGVVCPIIDNDYQEDWGLDDPSGKSDEEFIKTINIIDEKIKNLISRL